MYNTLIMQLQSERDMFASQATSDIEDIVSPSSQNPTTSGPTATTNKRKRTVGVNEESDDLNRSWRDVLGNPPNKGSSKVGVQIKLI